MPEQRFRKRPVEVAAMQWTGDNEAEVRQWCGLDKFGSVGPAMHRDPQITAEVLDTLHSTWVGMRIGDWVIRGVRGELYPIRPEVLVETYEPVHTDV